LGHYVTETGDTSCSQWMYQQGRKSRSNWRRFVSCTGYTGTKKQIWIWRYYYVHGFLFQWCYYFHGSQI